MTATVCTGQQQQLVALGFEAVGRGPIASGLALRNAPLLEVIFVEQV
jgi:hypothetical protein